MAKVKSIADAKRRKPLGVVIGVGNQKGGVGKTTTTVNIAAALGQRGWKVLIIDCDPTAGATKHLGVDGSEYVGIVELLEDKATLDNVVIDEGLPQGVHLVCSRLSLCNLKLPPVRDKTKIFVEPLRRARRRYDVIFLDTPPQPGAETTVGAYGSADWFLLCTHPDPLSVDALNQAFDDIIDVRRYSNRKLEVMGVALSRIKRNSKEWTEINQLIRERLPGRAFNANISDSVVVPRVSGVGKTLFTDSRFAKHKVTEEFRKLAVEIEYRFVNREKFLKKLSSRGRKPGERKVANA